MGNDARTVSHGRLSSFMDSEQAIKTIHLALLVVAAIAYALLANYDVLWFDEAYSVGMARKSFSDIVAIGANDVHPVLYYFVLHVIYLIVGQNIVAYRIFSVAGIIVMAALGFTHCRRDFGSRCGLLYTVLALLLPWAIHNAFQIRAYSWLAVSVMIAAIYGWRIVRMRICEPDDRGGSANAIPATWWVALTLSSIAAAYLHYYGAMAAFYIQFVVLVSILRNRANRKRNVLIWALCAFAAVLSYVPWLSVVASQATTVSGGFWINLGYPDSFSEILCFPFNALEAMYFSRWFGEGVGSSAIVLAIMFAVVAVEAGFVFGFGKAIGETRATSAESDMQPLVALYFFSVFAAVACIACIASVVLNQSILYYRYLSAALGPLVFAMAYVVVHVNSRVLRSLAGALVLFWAIASFDGLVWAAYNPSNDEVISEYVATCDQAAEMNEQQRPLVLSSDEGLASILAESTSGDSVVYASEAQKYRAFEPRFELVPSYESALDDYTGMVVFIGSHDDAESLADTYDGTVVDKKSCHHPYSDRDITFASIKI